MAPASPVPADVRSVVRRMVYRGLLLLPPTGWPRDGENLFDLGLDSLLVMDLLNELETGFGLVLDDDEIDATWLESVDSIVAFLVRRGVCHGKRGIAGDSTDATGPDAGRTE